MKRIRLEQVNEATNTFKAYEVVIEERPDGWAVSGWNGRIGKPLKEQPKVIGASREEAEKAFEALLRGQIKKGYLPKGEAAAQVAVPEGAKADPDLIPALPTAMGEEPITLRREEWLVQEKHDGENRPVRATADAVIFANRGGQPVPGTEALRDALAAIRDAHGPFLINAEDMGADGIVVFDVVEGFGVSRSSPFAERNEALARFAEAARDAALIRADVAVPLLKFEEDGGEAALRRANAEGYVLKRADAPYAPGRTNNPKKAAMLKVKFVEDATFRISEGREAGKRSVGIEAWDEKAGVWVQKGNVTVPVNAQMPEPGTFADVRYLYAYDGGSVYQPVWKGAREGVSPEDCAVSKLKMKAAPVLEDEDGLSM